MKNEDQKSMEFENEPVSNLLGSMKRVEAPDDFDFHVKARIAKGRPTDRNASLLPAWARFAVPLVLVMFAGGYFGFRALYSSVANVQPIAEVQQLGTVPVSEIPAREVVEPSANKVVIAQIDEKPSSNTTEKPGMILPEKLVARTGSSNKKVVGGSVDFGQREARTRSIKKPKDIENPGGIPAKDMLTQMGIDAGYSNSSWKVGSVKQNSIAERSGLKTGDMIEAINDQNLTEKTTLASPFRGKSIRVRRDDKIVQIELKP